MHEGFTAFCRLSHSILGPFRAPWPTLLRSRLSHPLTNLGHGHGGTSEELEKNIAFAGLRLKPVEVISGARLVFVLTLPVSLLGLLSASLLPFVLGLLLPPLSHRTVTSYPSILAKNIEKSSYREASEILTLMVGDSESTTHEKAALQAATGATGSLTISFRCMVWAVYTRWENVPEMFDSHAQTWAERNRGYAEALSVVSQAGGGKDADPHRAVRLAQMSAQRRLKGFLSSLRAPVNMIFALGIILPVMIVSMLPMSAITMADVSNPLVDTAPEPMNDLQTTSIAATLAIVFPLSMFVYCREVLSRHPLPKKHSGPHRRSLALTIVVAALAAGICLVGSECQKILGTPMVAIPTLMIVSVVVALIFVGESKAHKDSEKVIGWRERSRATRLLAQSLAGKNSPEVAMWETARKMEGTETSHRLREHLFLLTQGRLDLRGVSERLATRFPSADLDDAIKLVLEAADGDTYLASRVAERLSQDIRETGRIEEDARSEIGPIVQTVRNTVLFFAPLVLGVTASISLLMNSYFPRVPSTDSFWFILVLGFMLIGNLAVSVFFTETLHINRGRLMEKIGTKALVATAVYCVSVITSSFAFGVP